MVIEQQMSRFDKQLQSVGAAYVPQLRANPPLNDPISEHSQIQAREPPPPSGVLGSVKYAKIWEDDDDDDIFDYYQHRWGQQEEQKSEDEVEERKRDKKLQKKQDFFHGKMNKMGLFDMEAAEDDSEDDELGE